MRYKTITGSSSACPAVGPGHVFRPSRYTSSPASGCVDVSSGCDSSVRRVLSEHTYNTSLDTWHYSVSPINRLFGEDRTTNSRTAPLTDIKAPDYYFGGMRGTTERGTARPPQLAIVCL